MNITTPENKFTTKKPENTPSCFKCGHHKICAIAKAIMPLMGNWDDQNRPFEADKIAEICKEYAENFVVLKNTTEDKEFADQND